jgi:hypothetical protein
VAGRFPLYTDADIHGTVVDALRHAGWDVVRAIDTFPERTDAPVHFEYAAGVGRVLEANDTDMKVLAETWASEGRPFPGLVWWARLHYHCISPGEFVQSFDRLAAQDAPFANYPIVVISPAR